MKRTQGVIQFHIRLIYRIKTDIQLNYRITTDIQLNYRIKTDIQFIYRIKTDPEEVTGRRILFFTVYFVPGEL